MKAASRLAVSALLLVALALIVMPAVRAGEWNHATRVTFTNAVQLPGVVLAPGEYRFELINSPSNRHVVQVFNLRHDHVFGTWLTIATERPEPRGKTVFVMEERPYGEPPAIKKWFYPGELIGDEFVYSRKEVTEVAVATPAEVATPEQPVVTEQPAAPVEEVAPAPAPQPEPAPAVEPEKQAAPVEEKPEELPKTASNVYLFLLIGMTTVLSGAAIRRFAKS